MQELYNSDDYLQHYGVLGMKWGVRKGNVSKTFAKASRKADKLQKKAKKYAVKGTKKYFDSGKAYMTDFGVANNAKNLQKSATYMKKSAKYEKKAEKWIDRMSNEFSTVKQSDISPNHLRKGRNYIDMLLAG